VSRFTITPYATTYRIEVAYSEVCAMRLPCERELMLLVAKRFEEVGATVQDLKNPQAVLTRHAMLTSHTITFTLEVPSAHA
jgi:hypothetical protein